MSDIHFISETTWLQAVFRGFKRRCPQCGAGKIFRSYLQAKETCPACELDVKRFNPPDDGPAFFTMSIVLFFFVPLLLWVDIRYDISTWVLIFVFTPLTLFLALILLPCIKGAFIGAAWKAKPEEYDS